MSKTNHPEMDVESLYHKDNGDVFIKFIKPVRLTKEMFYRKHSITFKIPL